MPATVTRADNACPSAGWSLSQQVIALTNRPIHKADRDRAALHILDWIGCAFAGGRTEIGHCLQSLHGGHPLAIGTAAAMGGLGSLLEMDDIHRGALLHPGPAVIPAALAAGPTGGHALVDAVLAGYEAMIRLGRSVGPAHYAHFHNTSTCGGIGAAVAAARALSLGPVPTADAIGHAMSIAGGLWQCRNEPGATKHLHVAEAARRGLEAARYAKSGLTGPKFILEGPLGFFAGLAPDGDPARIIAEPDAPWLVHETSFKPWPACRHAHPAIDAALSLRGQLRGQMPAAIRVETFSDAILFCDKPDPKTDAEARFSLQHAVAVVLRDGPPRLEAFDPSAFPRYADLRGRTEVRKSEDFTQAYPAHFGARVDITLNGGERLSASVSDAWGDPENAMDADAIADKFDHLTAWAGIDPAAAGDIRSAVLALADDAPVATLRTALTRAAEPLSQGQTPV